MGFLSGLFHSRDKPTNSTNGSAYRFLFGGSNSGKAVNERSAMQMTAVYACVRILSESIAGLPVHVYKYTDSGSKEKAIKFFANGATPGGILEYPGTVKNPEAVRESWTKGFSGNNSHKVAVLEEGMKYTPISISPNEAQFLETRKFQIDEIARIFRVPPHMVGDLEKSSFSNIEQQSLEFVKYTLEPWIVRWEQSINRALLSDSEKAAYFVKFNVDGLLRGDYQSRMNGYATARQNGWMSANDIRELENLDLIPPELGGDLYLINGNMTKLEDAGIFAATTAAGKEDENNEEILEVEESDGDQSGDAGTDTGEDTVSKRHHRRGKLV